MLAFSNLKPMPDGLASNLAMIAYIAMYPGFYIYHDLAGREIITMFMGGWASSVNLLIAITVFPLSLFIFLRRKSVLSLILCMPIAIIIFYAAYYKFTGNGYLSSDELFVNSLKLAIGLAALYSVGLLYSQNNTMKYMLVFAWVSMTVLALLSTDWTSLAYSIPERTVPTGKISDYQGFATAFALTSVLSIGLINNKFFIGEFSILSSVVLFVIGSRSDMLGFVAAAFALAIFYFTDKRIANSLIIGICSILPIAVLLNLPTIVGAVSAQIEMIQQNETTKSNTVVSAPTDKELLAAREQTPPVESASPPTNVATAAPVAEQTKPAISGNMRQEELLNISNAQGLGIRIDTLKAAWANIWNSPVAGDYGGQIRDFGQFGMYAHNVLSAWQQFGIVGFFFYFGATILSTFYLAWIVLWGRDRSALGRSAFLAAAYALPLIVISKSVYWPIPALIWGMALNVAVARWAMTTPSAVSDSQQKASSQDPFSGIAGTIEDIKLPCLPSLSLLPPPQKG